MGSFTLSKCHMLKWKALPTLIIGGAKRVAQFPAVVSLFSYGFIHNSMHIKYRRFSANFESLAITSTSNPISWGSLL